MENDAEVVESQVEMLRQITRTGRPCGSAEFVAHAEHIAGRALAPKKPGPVNQKAQLGLS